MDVRLVEPPNGRAISVQSPAMAVPVLIRWRHYWKWALRITDLSDGHGVWNRIAWRLEALAEGDLSERAAAGHTRWRAMPTLRMIAPPDFGSALRWSYL